MNADIDQYQSALCHIEARVLDCFAGFKDGQKSFDEIVVEIRGIGDDIRAGGDSEHLAALDEIMYRPIRVWRALLDGPVDGGVA